MTDRLWQTTSPKAITAQGFGEFWDVFFYIYIYIKMPLSGGRRIKWRRLRLRAIRKQLLQIDNYFFISGRYWNLCFPFSSINCYFVISIECIIFTHAFSLALVAIQCNDPEYCLCVRCNAKNIISCTSEKFGLFFAEI